MAQKGYLTLSNVIPSHTLTMLRADWNGLCEKLGPSPARRVSQDPDPRMLGLGECLPTVLYKFLYHTTPARSFSE